MGRSVEEYDFQKGEILLFNKELDWTSFSEIAKFHLQKNRSKKAESWTCRNTGPQSHRTHDHMYRKGNQKY